MPREAAKGGRYVMPMAVCRPVMSCFMESNAIVTSPALPSGVGAGIGMRRTEPEPTSSCPAFLDGLLLVSHLRMVWILLASKCRQPRILRAAAGPATMMVLVPDGGRVRRDSSWQWSGLSWLTTTTSGSGMSCSEEMHGGSPCLVKENFSCQSVESPLTQGSRRMVKSSDGDGDDREEDEVDDDDDEEDGEEGEDEIGGRKVSKKVESALRCFTVRDMMVIIKSPPREKRQQEIL
jgi:hypothetical protein